MSYPEDTLTTDDQNSAQLDLLVIGAGPTGLMAACEALRLGMTVEIVDVKPHRSVISKALVMHARTLEGLEDLQISDRMIAAGACFEALNIQFGQRPATRVHLSGLAWGDTRYPFWLSIPQYETERILEERLNELGGSVAWGTRLIGFTQNTDAVTAELVDVDKSTTHRTARWLIGCDGGRSRTRDVAGISMARIKLNQTFVLADVKTTSKLVQNEGHTFKADDGLLLIVPMPEPDLFRIIAHIPDGALRDSNCIDAEWLDELILTRTGIEFGAHEVTWTSQFSLSQGVSEQYRSGRVFLAGDSAHIHSPVGGQGLNTGILDAQNLIWKLKAAETMSPLDEDRFLSSYEQERLPVASAMVRATGLATRVLTARNPILRWLIGFVASRVARVSTFQQRLAREIGMLNIGYGVNGLQQDTSQLNSVKSGSRVPNPELRPGTRLHDILASQGATLFLFESDGVRRRNENDEVQLEEECARSVRSALRMSETGVLLIRPDRYVLGTWNTLQDMLEFAPAAALCASLIDVSGAPE